MYICFPRSVVMLLALTLFFRLWPYSSYLAVANISRSQEQTMLTNKLNISSALVFHWNNQVELKVI